MRKRRSGCFSFFMLSSTVSAAKTAAAPAGLLLLSCRPFPASSLSRKKSSGPLQGGSRIIIGQDFLITCPLVCQEGRPGLAHAHPVAPAVNGELEHALGWCPV